MNRTGKYLANCLLNDPILLQVISKSIICHGFFIGHGKYNKDDNYIFILSTLIVTDLSRIEKLESYVDNYPCGEYWMFIFECPIQGLVEKFVKGKYSELYNEEYLKYFEKEGTEIMRVLSKSASYRLQLSNMLDVTIDEDAELDSIPNLAEEIYEFAL